MHYYAGRADKDILQHALPGLRPVRYLAAVIDRPLDPIAPDSPGSGLRWPLAEGMAVHEPARIDRAAEVVEQSTGTKPKLFITGGDAGMITGTMRAQGEIVPDLVLQGLAVIAAQGR